MLKFLWLIPALILVGCAEIKPKPATFLEATVTEITNCHDFKIRMNGQREVWVGCKLRLLADRGWPRLQLTYQTLGENHYQVGQKVIIGWNEEYPKEVITISPKK